MRRWGLVMAAMGLAAGLHWQVLVAAGHATATEDGRRLAAFPRQMGDWMAVEELALAAEVERAVGADQVMSRRYLHVPSGVMGEVFLGYFASAAPGVLADREPHLPTVCLPAAGWTVVRQEEVGGAVRMEVVSGRERREVTFWHQTARRVVANPLWLRWYGPVERWETGRNDFVLARVVSRESAGNLVPALMVSVSKWITELPLEGGRK